MDATALCSPFSEALQYLFDFFCKDYKFEAQLEYIDILVVHTSSFHKTSPEYSEILPPCLTHFDLWSI